MSGNTQKQNKKKPFNGKTKKGKKSYGKQVKLGKQIRKVATLDPKQPGQVTFVQLPSTLVPTLQVTCSMVTGALRMNFYSLLSYLAQRGLINSTSNGLNYDIIYPAMNYLLQSTAQLIQGTTVNIDQVPMIVDNLISALQGKQIKFKGGKISYGWQNFGSSLVCDTVSWCNGQWAPTYTNSDNNSYNSPVQIYPTAVSADKYTQFIQIIGALDAGNSLKFVKYGTCKTLARDVSAFARKYIYDGIKGFASTNGYWGDAENEVQVRAISMTKYCEYDQPDLRVPLDLKADGLGPAFGFMHPLFPSFTSYYNRQPAVGNQINLDEFVVLYGLWLSNLVTEYVRIGGGNTAAFPLPIPCTAQDLYVVWLNAALQMCQTQSMMQWTGDVNYDATTNCFVPFLALGHNTGNSTFGRLQMPSIMAENFMALMTRNIGKAGSNNMVSYLPVIGRYYQDTLPQNYYYSDGAGNSQPLFLPSGVQDPINFTDCSTSPNIYVNTVGNYYQAVLSAINETVTSLQGYSAPIQPLFNDGGPKGLFLTTTTRVVKNSEQDLLRRRGSGAPPAKISVSSLWKVNGSPMSKVEGEKAVKQVQAIPPASQTSLYPVELLSATPITNEMLELLDLVILPTTRTNETEDAITIQMLQTIKREPYQLAYQLQGLNFSGIGEYQRLNTYAGLLSHSFAREAPNKFVQVFSQLISRGEAGILSGLLGGFAKSIFPEASGVIDTVASVLPF